MLKKGTGDPLSKIISKGSSCNRPEEVFNNLMPEDFSSKNTFLLIMICHLTGSNSRYALDSSEYPIMMQA
jgi:hypothetical protein